MDELVKARMKRTKKENIEYAKKQIKIYTQKRDLIAKTPVSKLNIVIMGQLLNPSAQIYKGSFKMPDTVKLAIIDDLSNMIKEYESIIEDTSEEEE